MSTGEEDILGFGIEALARHMKPTATEAMYAIKNIPEVPAEQVTRVMSAMGIHRRVDSILTQLRNEYGAKKETQNMGEGMMGPSQPEQYLVTGRRLTNGHIDVAVVEGNVRRIVIHKVVNGYLLKVGCQTVVFETAANMLGELGRYLTSPVAVEEEYLKAIA